MSTTASLLIRNKALLFLADAGKYETCLLNCGFKYFLLYNMIWTTFLMNSRTDSDTSKRKDILTIKHVSDEN